MADKKTIQQMQADLQAFRASKSGTTAPAAAVPSVPAPSGATGSAMPTSKIVQDLASYRQQRDSGTLPDAIPKDNPSALAAMAKSLFTAPATIVARPFQAAAELAGASSEDVDAATKKIPIVGGLIAPVPQNAADVKKDVGRGIQTVALGVDAPLAGGAAFGAGASLEQGNDLLSAQTLVDTALGAAGGKVLDWVGKPLLNAAGKVVGTITPKIIKDVTAKGSDAIAKFAADHQLLGGIAAKPAAAIKRGAQAVDDAVGAGFRKGGAALKSTAKEQFPDLDPTAHYTAVNERDIRQPTTVNAPAYSKATAVFNKAKDQGINLDKVATENGVYHHNIAEGKNYNTADTVEHLRDQVYTAGGEKARPAIKIASYETPRVSNAQIHGALRQRIHDLPATEADATEKEAMLEAIDKRYGPDSASARAHPDGYDLTDLHDNRIRAGKNGHYIPGVSDAPTTAKAKLSRLEESVFRKTFDRSAPKELKIDDFRRESQKILSLADYLEELHGKRVPEGVTKKAVRLFGRGLGGALGSKVGGFPGFLVGSRGGDMLFSTFEEFPNPIKTRILNRLKVEEPAAFKSIVDYIGKKEAERLLQHALPAAGKSSFKATKPTLFATPGGVITPDKGAAIDVTAVEKGNAKAPKSGRSPAATKKLIEYIQENGQGPYVPAKDLPVIKTGRMLKKPSSLKDIL